MAHASKDQIPAEKMGDYEGRLQQFGGYYVNFETMPAGTGGPEIFEGLEHMTGAAIVSLPRTHDVLAAVRVAEPNLPFEDVSPVLGLAGIVGQALEKLRAGREARWQP